MDDRYQKAWREFEEFLLRRCAYFDLRKRTAHLREAKVILEEMRRIEKKWKEKP